MKAQVYPDILCFSSTDWSGIWGSRQQVMLRFAQRGYRVLYIEQLAGLEHLLRYPELRKRKLERWMEGKREIKDNLWILSAPPLLFGRYYSRNINKLNAWLLSGWTRHVLKKMDFMRPILWLYKPEHSDLIGRFDEQLVVYHCIDEWAAGTRTRKRQTIAQMDNHLTKNAGLVFANSPPTYQHKLSLNPDTHRVPSGVDIDLFSQAISPTTDEHNAISCVSQPRIGYVGTINERLDYTFLEYLAGARPQWNLVLIGDPYPWRMDAPALKRMAAFPNVHFLGKFPHRELPALLKGMDVCLVPYVGDERGFYRSPLKLYEYLAAGRAVVSTPNPEVSEFSPLVHMADTPEAFVEQIAIAMAQDTPEKQKQRLHIAKSHSWEERVNQMEVLIQQALARGK